MSLPPLALPPDAAPGHGQPMAATFRAAPPLPITCGTDRRAHLVSDDDHVAGLAAGRGRFRALCGHQVTAAALVSPDGRPCPRCAQVAAERPAQQRQRGRHRVSHAGRTR